MVTPIYLLYLVVAVSGVAFEKEVVPSCGPEEDLCEFHWTIDYKETMVYFKRDSHVGEPVVLVNETLYKRTSCNTLEPISDEELQNVTTADGRYKSVYAINQQVPGPPVVVYQGQQVVVHVHNKLLSDGVTIHWHGLTQKGTPWMDGTGSISQCPIDPHSTFVYRFMADDVGTSWYHAHHGMMRNDGLAGPLIVLPRDNVRADNATATVDKQYILFVQDWFYMSGQDIYSYFSAYLNPYFNGLDKEGCTKPGNGQNGEIIGDIPFESAIINGKGRYNESIGGLPYESFTVKTGGVYQFRIINAAMVYAFRVSVDQHPLTVISTDGNDVTEFEAESVVVHSGERFDVIIRADQRPGSYWIRTETLDTPLKGETSSPSSGLAVLQYQDADPVLPQSQKAVCEKNSPCKVVNCLFLYSSKYNIQCTSVADLRATPEGQTINPVPTVTSTERFQELFLNFVYARSRTPISAAVNNKGFVRPSVPLQTYPVGDGVFTECPEHCDKYCTCTHVIKLGMGNTVQLVLLNMNDSPYGLTHPIHIHGHHAHIIKVVYPEYDQQNGKILERSQDIRCDTPNCNNATWSNSSWQFGNVPGVNLDNPPQKDTVSIPRQGYVVMRMTADNPGYWFLHCHIEVHQTAGMTLVLQDGEITDMPALPVGFPTCGDYRPATETKLTDNTSLSTRLGSRPSVSASDNDGSACVTSNKADKISAVDQRTSYILLICILAVTNVASLIVACVGKRRRTKISFVLKAPSYRRPIEINDKPEPEVFFSKNDELCSSKEKLLLT
ncbi:L-ascorbate oxidase-like [Mizuhopecten yessoensis]|uniref:L-ascorbate oxidase n=1 Tax=Mizuhopecten yessoensis TaxID=6573 RepID=A0A210QYR9_MIZYE|nr:L-ascorbate oxidase-like [Mizuhopecten yessoensis]OWF53933.1 L-ascorbate oxidase [Mizuhopecten yessoensis]